MPVHEKKKPTNVRYLKIYAPTKRGLKAPAFSALVKKNVQKKCFESENKD